MKCVFLIVCATFARNISHFKKTTAKYNHEYPLCLSGFNETQILNFMKIRPVGAELFHTDRQTNMTKLTVAFRNFSNAPKTVNQ